MTQGWRYDGEIAVNDDVIIRLQATSFSSFSYEQKRNVLDAGKPKPGLKLVKQKNVFLRKFDPNLYDKFNWLWEAFNN